MSSIRYGFQTTEQYSNTGRTYVLKAAIEDEMFRDSKHRKIKLAINQTRQFLTRRNTAKPLQGRENPVRFNTYIRYMSIENLSRVYTVIPRSDTWLTHGIS